MEMAQYRIAKAFTVALAAASIAVGTAAAETEITVEYPWPDTYTFLPDIVKVYEQEFPNYKVKLRTTHKDYFESVQALIRQSMTGQMPDVSLQGYSRLRVLGDKGIAVDLTPFVTKEKDWTSKGFDDVLMGLGRVGDNMVGLPFTLSMPISYFNPDLVKKAGGDPQNFPKRWDDVLDLAKKISALGPDIHGIFLPRSSGNWYFSAMLHSQGARFMTPDEKKVAFNSPEGLAAISLYGTAMKNGSMPNFTTKNARQDYFSGRLGIIFASTANIKRFTKAIGGRFSLETAAYPMGDSANGAVSVGGAAWVMTANDPKKQAAVWNFMKFFSGARGATMMAKATGYVPPNKVAADDPRYMGKFYKENPKFRVAVDMMHLMAPWYAFPGANGMKITGVILDNLNTVVDQSVKPKAALDKMAREIQALVP
jgi:multiple sugar transport system substrate-binding protein